METTEQMVDNLTTAHILQQDSELYRPSFKLDAKVA